jgi:hypothetical protein
MRTMAVKRRCRPSDQPHMSIEAAGAALPKMLRVAEAAEPPCHKAIAPRLRSRPVCWRLPRWGLAGSTLLLSVSGHCLEHQRLCTEAWERAAPSKARFTTVNPHRYVRLAPAHRRRRASTVRRLRALLFEHGALRRDAVVDIAPQRD